MVSCNLLSNPFRDTLKIFGTTKIVNYDVIFSISKRPLTLSREKLWDSLVEMGVTNEWREVIHMVYE